MHRASQHDESWAGPEQWVRTSRLPCLTNSVADGALRATRSCDLLACGPYSEVQAARVRTATTKCARRSNTSSSRAADRSGPLEEVDIVAPLPFSVRQACEYETVWSESGEDFPGARDLIGQPT